MSLAVLAAAVFDARGLIGSAGVRRPELRPLTPPRWRDVSAAPFPSYRRLPGHSKGLCLTAEAAGLRAFAGADTATVLGTCLGCLDADLRFQESLHGDAEVKPGLFPYTLPSTCLGELAILYGLQGPSLCLSTADGDDRAAFLEAATLIDSGEAERALVCAGEWLGSEQAAGVGLAARAAFHVALLGPGPGLCALGDVLEADAPAATLRAALEGAP